MLRKQIEDKQQEIQTLQETIIQAQNTLNEIRTNDSASLSSELNEQKSLLDELQHNLELAEKDKLNIEAQLVVPEKPHGEFKRIEQSFDKYHEYKDEKKSHELKEIENMISELSQRPDENQELITQLSTQLSQLKTASETKVVVDLGFFGTLQPQFESCIAKDQSLRLGKERLTMKAFRAIVPKFLTSDPIILLEYYINNAAKLVNINKTSTSLNTIQQAEEAKRQAFRNDLSTSLIVTAFEHMKQLVQHQTEERSNELLPFFDTYSLSLLMEIKGKAVLTLLDLSNKTQIENKLIIDVFKLYQLVHIPINSMIQHMAPNLILTFPQGSGSIQLIATTTSKLEREMSAMREEKYSETVNNLVTAIIKSILNIRTLELQAASRFSELKEILAGPRSQSSVIEGQLLSSSSSSKKPSNSSSQLSSSSTLTSSLSSSSSSTTDVSELERWRTSGQSSSVASSHFTSFSSSSHSSAIASNSVPQLSSSSSTDISDLLPKPNG